MYLGLICQYVKNVFFTSGPSSAFSSLFLALCGNKNVKRYYVIMLLCHEEPFSVLPAACAPRFSLSY